MSARPDRAPEALGPAHLGALPLLLGACLLLAAALSGGLPGEVAGQGAPPPPAAGPNAHLSTLIYPEQQIRLRMSHAHPAHRRLRCVRCHERAGRSDRSRDLLIPSERSCLPCHEAQIARRRGGNSVLDAGVGESSENLAEAESSSATRCAFCHVGHTGGARGAEDGSAEVPASDLPPPRLRFSHRAHVSRGMRCLSCHRGIASAAEGTREHLPSMRQCFECHAPAGLGPPATAPSACATCHLTDGDGRLRTRFGREEMNPPVWLGGMHHDRDWMVRHRWIAADQGERCSDCHRERECADCHDGRVRIRRVHRNDYLTIHPAEARRDSPRCASCHNQESFCVECHARLGISPTSAPEVRALSRFHPPSEVWIRGPALHGREARRAMGTCVSCHAERDCTPCHAAGSLGAGISPHPPGFASGCRLALERNARACASCHADLDALRATCR